MDYKFQDIPLKSKKWIQRSNQPNLNWLVFIDLKNRKSRENIKKFIKWSRITIYSVTTNSN